MILEGEHLQLSTKELKKHIGQAVKYILERDVDKSGRGYVWTRCGTIDDVYYKQVCLNGEFVHIKNIREIVKL